MPTEASPKSKLVIVGVLLILYALFVPIPLEQFITQRFPLTLPLALLIDASKATLFVGLGVLAIGLLRNRQARKKAERAQ
jgi:hypothetical protein